MTKGSTVQMTKGLQSLQRELVLRKKNCLSIKVRNIWAPPAPTVWHMRSLVSELCWVITCNMCHRLGPEWSVKPRTKPYQKLQNDYS